MSIKSGLLGVVYMYPSTKMVGYVGRLVASAMDSETGGGMTVSM